MTISIICAATDNLVIGKDGDMPWHMPNDLKFFKRTTLGHHIIMGRKTFDAFGNGKPLPKRTNVVVTRNKNLKIEGVRVVHSLEEGIAIARNDGDEECFIIGGEQIYRLGMPYANRVYLTRIHTQLVGDTFFPELDTEVWEQIYIDKHPADERHKYAYSFTTWHRRKEHK